MKMQRFSIPERKFYETGQVFQEYIGNENSGTLREYHQNGQLAFEHPMKSGLRHGMCKQWDDHGRLLGAYEMNMGTGTERRWHSNGRLQFEGHLIREAFNGRLRGWRTSGELELEIFAVNKVEVSKAEYDRARQKNPELPAYESD